MVNYKGINGLGPVLTYRDTSESVDVSFWIKKFPRPHISGYESNYPVDTYPDSFYCPGLLSIYCSIEHAQYPISRVFLGKFVFVSNNVRFFVFFECKYFALLLAICHSKGRTHKKRAG